VRFLEGDEIPLILAKTPMPHRAPLLRRLPVRLLNVNKQVLALAPPEILAMLAEDSARAAAEASETATRRAAAPYRFVDPVRVLADDYAKLDDVAKSQWRTAAGAYVESGTVEDPQDFVRQLAKEGLNEGDAQLQYWKVLRGNSHVFDLWVVWVENGSFFVAGQRDRVSVHIVQGRFVALEDTPEAHELAADLSDSQRVSLWDLATRSSRRPASI
jgi:hypothetical protein